MKLTKILTAAAMVSLMTAPVAAQAADTSRVASTHEGEDIAGVSPLILVLVAAAAIAAIVIIADDNDKPASP
jgi:hypothetical protein